MAASAHPLTVAHYARQWLPQTQTWLYNQVRHLPPEVTSHIICERTENLDQFELPHIHSLADDARARYYWEVGLRLLGAREYYPFTVDEVRKSGARILHSHFGSAGWRNIEVARQAGVKHVVTFYGNDATSYPNKDERWVARYQELFDAVEAVLCEGPHMAQTIRGLGCPEEKTRVHHLGVPVDDLAFEPRTIEPGGTLRVLLVASIREKKGLPYALEALGRLQEEVPVSITFIGGASRVPLIGPISKPMAGVQEEKERIEQTIEDWNLGDKIDMMGYQPHRVMLEEAYKHHVFLSPSVTARDGDGEGGAPVTLIEMAATGMPIVSTRHGDIPSVVLHDESGYLATERDVDALVEYLRRLARHPETWEEMGEAGRRHIEAEYNAPVQGKRLGAIYQDIAAS